MKIGLLPMAAKPYHAGHHGLLKNAAKENDVVYLFVSLSDRKRKGEMTIYGRDMERIWREKIEKILPKNVNVEYGGSPVGKVLELLDEAEKQYLKVGFSKDVYSVYSDPVDTEKNYLMVRKRRDGSYASNKDVYFPTIYDECIVTFPAELNPRCFARGEGMPDVSGTKMRKKIELGDVEGFSSDLPTEFSDAEKIEIYNILRKEKIEESIALFIKEVLTR